MDADGANVNSRVQEITLTPDLLSSYPTLTTQVLLSFPRSPRRSTAFSPTTQRPCSSTTICVGVTGGGHI